eukprot:1206696-Pleurochrysis_carterae.AAC.2
MGSLTKSRSFGEVARADEVVQIATMVRIHPCFDACASATLARKSALARACCCSSSIVAAQSRANACALLRARVLAFWRVGARACMPVDRHVPVSARACVGLHASFTCVRLRAHEHVHAQVHARTKTQILADAFMFT